MPKSGIHQTIDHLFRHEYGRIVAGLTARFGSSQIEWIEDAVQEALYKAMKLWAFQPIPSNPGGWLYRVAHNALVDRLRKEKRHQDYAGGEIGEIENAFEMRDSKAIQDEQLKMIFACCSPKISEKNSLLLSLKLIGGFSVKEIGRALLMKEEAAKKSVQRARADFQIKIGQIRLPEGNMLPQYLERVLKVIYLIFNEGYKASDGDQLVKEDLCGEALRLALLLSQKDHCQTSELLSLISLICFKASRFGARIDTNGNLVLFENQDRGLYNKEYANWGFYYFNEATKFGELTRYFLEAAIEYQYCIAGSFEEVNWKKVLAVHEKLQERWPSPRGRLNYLIVHARVNKAEATLQQLKSLEKELYGDHHYHTFKGELLEKLDLKQEAMQEFQIALTMVQNRVEHGYLQRRLQAIAK